MKALLLINLIFGSLGHSVSSDTNINEPSYRVRRSVNVNNFSSTNNDSTQGIEGTDLRRSYMNNKIFKDLDADIKSKKTGPPCCNGMTCFPCPYPLPMPYPMPPAPMNPMVIPVETFYEPVIHDHPPIHKIREIIAGEKGKRRKKKWRYSELESSDTSDTADNSDTADTSDTSDSDDGNSSIDYYDDVLHVKG